MLCVIEDVLKFPILRFDWGEEQNFHFSSINTFFEEMIVISFEIDFCCFLYRQSLMCSKVVLNLTTLFTLQSRAMETVMPWELPRGMHVVGVLSPFSWQIPMTLLVLIHVAAEKQYIICILNVSDTHCFLHAFSI